MIAALLSGSFAAFASACGKFAFDESLDWMYRGVALSSLILCNVVMLQFFVRALRDSGSVVGTTVNASANVAVSAIIGALVFGELERLTPHWFAGATLVVLGIYCISRGTREKPKQA